MYEIYRGKERYVMVLQVMWLMLLVAYAITT